LIPFENNCFVPANSLISFRTTLIPRASDAFNSNVIELYFDAPYIRFAAATIVLVLPVPGGPYKSKCGRLSLSIKFVIILIIFSCATKSSSLF
jgi:hypothetical protein